MFADSIKLTNFKAIPISGLKGDNILFVYPIWWYRDETLLEYLENIKLKFNNQTEEHFRMLFSG